MRKLTNLTALKATSFTILGLAFLSVLYFLPQTLKSVDAQGLEGLSVTPASFELSATTTYTFSFIAPMDLDPFSGFMVSAWFNGPQGVGTTVDFTESTLNSLKVNGSTVGGSVSRMDDFQDSMINVGLESGASEGDVVEVLLANVFNPEEGGQYSFNVNVSTGGGPDNDIRGTENLLLGYGEIVKTVTGQVTYEDDGSPVTDAQIDASQRGGMLFLNTNVNDDGEYSLGVPAGDWEIRVGPQWGEGGQVPVDWAYLGHGGMASFASNNESEVKEIDFSVVSATATVTGKIVDPDGNPVGGGVDIRSKDGVGVGAGTSPEDGLFSANVPAGSYRIGVFSEDQSLTAPQMDPFTVGDGQTKSLGTITLARKTSHIKGSVVDSQSGDGVAGVRVETWSPEGGGWGETSTDGDGGFDLLVGPGTWEVNAMPDPDSGYTFESGPPTRIEIGSNETKTGYVMTVIPANSTIQGRVVDVDGNQINDFFGFAMAMEGDGDPPKPGPGTNVDGGQFQMAVPAGTWSVDVHTEPGSNYSSTGSVQVTVTDDETATIEITMKENDAFVQGVVKDEEGNTITNVYGEVFAENGRGAFRMANINSDGTYSMGVVGGDSWFLGVFVDPNSGYMMLPPSDSKTTVNSGQTVTKDFTLLTANATIEGTVLDPDGNGLSNVFVFADTHLSEEGDVLGLRIEGAPENAGAPGGGKADLRQGVHTGDLTRSDGSFSLQVPAGTYGLGSGAPASLGYISPEFQTVTVTKNETATGVTLQYKESNAQITGSVMLDGAVHEGFVSAWSEKGAHSETYSRTGEYLLNVTSDDLWHVGADFEAQQTFYQSSEYVVDLTGRISATQDLELVQSSFRVPPAVSQTIDAATGGTVQLEDGTQLIIPSGAFGSSGSYTVTITPTVQLTKEKNNRPLAFGYSIKAIDSTGQTFTSNFNSNARLVMPYTEEMLVELGITEDDISAKFFDPTSGAWQGVASFTVNKEDNTLIATIQHFTEFAPVTGSADSTPPSGPTGVTTSVNGTTITISWTNPTDTDFAGVRIYRSITSGTTGDLVSRTSGTTASYEDTGLVAGTTYYYTLRAVDAVGNASTGTSQVSGVATAVELPTTGVSIASAIGFYGMYILGALMILVFPAGFLLLRRVRK